MARRGTKVRREVWDCVRSRTYRVYTTGYWVQTFGNRDFVFSAEPVSGRAVGWPSKESSEYSQGIEV